MTQAEKIAEEWAEKVLTTRWVDGEPFLSYIQQVGERTLEECEKASTFELAPHPRWSMKVGDAIRARRWWEEEA